MPAAGSGKRMGADIPKQYLKLGSSTILEITVRALLKSDVTQNIIIGLSEDDQWFDKLPIAKDKRIIKAHGGNERSDTVRNCLAKVSTAYVMVHDAARPLVDPDDIKKLALSCTAEGFDDGGILASPVADTIKQELNDTLSVDKTVPRQHLYRALTPQLFKTALLKEALQYAYDNGIAITDDASAMELYGYHPKLIPGSSTNIKITTPDDLLIANAIISSTENHQDK